MFRRARVLPAVLAAVAAAAPAQDWALRTSATAPLPSTFPRMAYDVARARCVMFGGWNAPVGSVVFRETWEWDGTNWVLRAPAVSPPERDDHAMVYDLLRGRTVLFGGEDFAFNLVAETWEWDGTSWLDRQPANAPSGRLGAPMCFDIARGVTVLFGGASFTADFGDTWEWDGTDWRQVVTANAPFPRSHHALAYDSVRNRVVLFGGNASGTLLDETWEYDGADWTQIATDGAPSARVDHGMAFDTSRARVVLFGGADALVDRNDTWEYDGVRWYDVTTATSPQGNAAMACAYDLARSRVVVFGGYDGAGAIGDTWEYGGQAPTYRTFGRGCNGSNGAAPALAARSVPRIGQQLTLDIGQLHTAGSNVGVLVSGLSATAWNGLVLPVDLGRFGLTGCVGYTSADASLIFVGAGGAASVTIAVPNNPALSGLVVYHQVLSLDPAVARPLLGAVSNAGEATVRN